MMKHSTSFRRAGAWAAACLALAAAPATAISPLMDIDLVYTNASGTVQFIVAIDRGMNDCDSGEALWRGERLVGSGPAPQRVFVFPNDLPTCRTSGRRVLIATEGFAALGIVTPDFVIPNDFVQRPAGSLRLGSLPAFTYDNLPTDGVLALNSVGIAVQNVATNLAGASASVVPAGGFVELNQHGLTGTWFEPATSGQGMGLEIFPGAGAGLAFITWFTYDTIAGGAERQRWYSAQGVVTTGQPTAQLTIYRNTGGNFAAPPVTTAEAIGTATLSFATCASGQLAYTFADGSARTGTIPLARVIGDVTCSPAGTFPTDPDFALSGNWFSAATSGQGFTAEVNPVAGVFFVAWYTYAPDASGAGVAGRRWYTAQASFQRGQRSVPVTISETKGGAFDATTPAPATSAVGTGTWSYQGCSSATFTYSFTGGSSAGRSGSIPLTRVGPPPPGCAP
jgi:hypothetical protein